MTAGSPSALASAAALLMREKHTIAVASTERFLADNPDWVERYGSRAYDFGVEDARFHIDFLVAALEAECPEAFADYARWAAAMLASRGILPDALCESFERIRDELLPRLDSDQLRAEVAAYLEHGCAAGDDEDRPPVSDAAATEPGSELEESREAFVAAILDGDRERAVEVLGHAIRGHPLVDVYTHVAAGAMVEVGRRWQACDIGVADEHRATAVAEFAIACQYPNLPRRPPAKAGRAVVSGVQDELHQFGTHLLADLLEFEGWDVRFLGTNLPAHEIAAALESHQADLLALGTTLLPNLSKARQVTALVKARRPSCRVLVGGRAYRALGDGARLVGADAFARSFVDAMSASRSFAGTG